MKVPAGSSISHDEQAIDRAIQESLQGSYNDLADESIEDTPIEDRIRKDNRPIALRATKSTLTYATLLIQGLFFVPQVRLGIARFRPTDGVQIKEDVLWALVELYTNMDIALLSDLMADVVLSTFQALEWSNPADHPGNLSRELYKKVTMLVEEVFFNQFVSSGYPGPRPRLFHFLHGQSDNDPRKYPTETELVTVTVGGNAEGDNNDLISCLSAQLSAPLDQPAQQEHIFEPSDVVAFELVGNSIKATSKSTSYGGGTVERKAFRYPKHIYLDQFLQVNAELANAKRAEQREMSDEVEKLFIRRKSLTSFENKDTLKDLRASLYYYENVADPKGDPVRQADIKRTGGKLKEVLTTIEREIEAIDSRVIHLKEEVAVLFDIPDLQKLRYDLRVVFIHDGIFGRKHLYSYVEDKGKWWKTFDNTVTEVSEETVLTDPAGLHLAAGPYLLLYSKSMPPEHASELERLPWPDKIKNSAKHNNMAFLSQIRQEVASQVYDFNSPPTSPMSQFTSLQHAADSNDLPEQSQEPMDVS
jgi:hypothetical protein